MVKILATQESVMRHAILWQHAGFALVTLAMAAVVWTYLFWVKKRVL